MGLSREHVMGNSCQEECRVWGRFAATAYAVARRAHASIRCGSGIPECNRGAFRSVDAVSASRLEAQRSVRRISAPVRSHSQLSLAVPSGWCVVCGASRSGVPSSTAPQRSLGSRDVLAQAAEPKDTPPLRENTSAPPLRNAAGRWGQLGPPYVPFRSERISLRLFRAAVRLPRFHRTGASAEWIPQYCRSQLSGGR